jgi:hypothetical protein
LSREHRKERANTCGEEMKRMSVRSSEIGGEITRQLADGQRAHFFGADMPAESSDSPINRMPRVVAGKDTQLVRRGAMHTDPQVLFAMRSSDRIMLARGLP